MKKKPNKPAHIGKHCYECANAYDWHHLSVNNLPTLAHCKEYINHPYCVIRSQRACEKFKPKKL